MNDFNLSIRRKSNEIFVVITYENNRLEIRNNYEIVKPLYSMY